MTDADNLIRQLDEKDAEIGRLESLLDRARPLARKNLEQAAEIEELKAEIAALREACKEVLDYEQGIGEYNYSSLPSFERAEASFLAWLGVREKVRRALEGQP